MKLWIYDTETHTENPEYRHKSREQNKWVTQLFLCVI